MSDTLPHVHYCKDFRDTTTCFDRGYCECKCGAQAPVVESPDDLEWREAGDKRNAVVAGEEVTT